MLVAQERGSRVKTVADTFVNDDFDYRKAVTWPPFFYPVQNLLIRNYPFADAYPRVLSFLPSPLMSILTSQPIAITDSPAIETIDYVATDTWRNTGNSKKQNPARGETGAGFFIGQARVTGEWASSRPVYSDFNTFLTKAASGIFVEPRGNCRRLISPLTAKAERMNGTLP